MTYNIFGIDFQEKPDTTVRVWVDEDIKNNNKGKRFKQTKADKRKQLEKDGLLAGENKGGFQATGRDERIYKLRIAYEQGSIKTLQEAVEYIGVTKRTLIDYLKEMGIRLYDTESKKEVGLLKGQTRKIRSGTSGQKSKSNVFEYYTKDPAQGGQLVDKDTYNKLRKG